VFWTIRPIIQFFGYSSELLERQDFRNFCSHFIYFLVDIFKFHILESGFNISEDDRQEERQQATKSIAAIGAGRKNNQQQCISKLWFRRT
jgi:hypothetical protein